MFLVNEDPRHRENKIREFLQRDPSVAVLVAAAHFEWTVCRAALFLRKAPTREIRGRLAGTFGLDRYKDMWREEVGSQPEGQPLTQVVSN